MSRIATLSMLFVLLVGIVGTAQAKLYRWVDEEGNVHYSDRVPPAAAEKERKVLNEEGRTIERHQRAKTREEVEQQRRSEQQIIEEARRREEQQRQDRMLLMTFTTAEDLEHVRDDRVAAVDAQIMILDEKLERLRKARADLDAQAAKLTQGGQAMISDDLNQRLQRNEAEIRRSEAYLESRRAERQAIVDKFNADLERFKELKAKRSRR
ncbi:MAG: DUF4124 domain-containing protein [Chromatiales bacterium]|jgi:hypothetical protein